MVEAAASLGAGLGAVGRPAREVQVLALIAEGLTNQEIADRVFVSINSVKTYVRSAYRKIGVNSRSQAAVWAMQHGIVRRDAGRVPSASIGVHGDHPVVLLRTGRVPGDRPRADRLADHLDEPSVVVGSARMVHRAADRPGWKGRPSSKRTNQPSSSRTTSSVRLTGTACPGQVMVPLSVQRTRSGSTCLSSAVPTTSRRSPVRWSSTTRVRVQVPSSSGGLQGHGRAALGLSAAPSSRTAGAARAARRLGDALVERGGHVLGPRRGPRLSMSMCRKISSIT